MLVLAVVVAALSLGQGASAATTWVVDDNSCPAGTGTAADPFCTITDAVAAASDGDTIVVRAGTYTESVLVDKSLNIRGPQAGETATSGRTNASAEATLDSPTGAFKLVDDNITINGFTIEWMTDTGIGTFGAGIFTDAAHSGYRILNNIIRENVMGIFLNSDGTNPTLVAQNRFQANNEAGSGSGTAIDSESGLHATTIRDNLFIGNSNASVLVSDAGTNDGITILRNRATSPILLYNTSDSSVTANNLSGNVGSAVFLGGDDHNVVISRNTIYSPVYSGIRSADNPSAPNTAITMSNNRIRGAGFYGIHIGASSLNGGTIRGNVVVGSDPDGIFTESGNTGNVFVSNTVRNSRTIDIRDESTGGGTAGTANSYTDNRCDTSDPSGLCV
jgi:nitrous oxidase accessory protein NosD